MLFKKRSDEVLEVVRDYCVSARLKNPDACDGYLDAMAEVEEICEKGIGHYEYMQALSRNV